MMDLSQFDDITSGPWKAHTSGTGHVCTLSGYVVAEVLHCVPFDRTDIEQNATARANARAIAALPDIIAYARKLQLEAENARLREFAQFLAQIQGKGVQVVGVPQGIRERARAALKGGEDG